MTKRNMDFAVAAAATMWAAFQPGSAPAQSSGVGGDGYTRLLWTATDSSISLWKLDPVLNFVTSHLYGPYDGWTPVGITTTFNNNTCVLWKRTDGVINLWTVDPNLNFVSSTIYGPFTGWTAQSLSPELSANGRIRVIWRETKGLVSVWELSNCESFVRNAVYGPYFGYVPGTSKALSGPADTKAAAAMGNATPVNPAPAKK